MSTVCSDKPAQWKVGERVQLHPGTDLWMRGARFGTVVKTGRKFVHVKMDHPQVRRVIRVSPEWLVDMPF